ncbi:hypothetical protein VN97_g12687, partial [Penicillium thymicola]
FPHFPLTQGSFQG